MGKLPRISARDAIKAFTKAGFEQVRSDGSHFVLTKVGHRFNLVIPVHGNRTLQAGLLNSLIKSSGLTVDQFIEYL